jgi:hypothetical protein
MPAGRGPRAVRKLADAETEPGRIGEFHSDSIRQFPHKSNTFRDGTAQSGRFAVRRRHVRHPRQPSGFFGRDSFHRVITDYKTPGILKRL